MRYITTFLFVLTFLSASANATHKAWVLKQSGAFCKLWHPTVSEVTFPGVVESRNRVNALVSCPLVLSAMGGSSTGPVTPAPTWLSAKQARIYFRQGRGAYWCRARAEDASGNAYYSDLAFGSDPGVQSVDLIEDEKYWRGWDTTQFEWSDLRNVSDVAQIDYECVTGSADARDPAQLIGYDLAICQGRSMCTTVRVDSARHESTNIQGSGIECLPGPSEEPGVPPLFSRNEYGFRNDSSETMSVYCPIATPTDDSYEHQRQIELATLHYYGRMPHCSLLSIDDSGVEHVSMPFELSPYYQSVELASTFRSRVDKSLFIRCELNSGSLIEGFVARSTITRKSGGI